MRRTTILLMTAAATVALAPALPAQTAADLRIADSAAQLVDSSSRGRKALAQPQPPRPTPMQNFKWKRLPSRRLTFALCLGAFILGGSARHALAAEKHIVMLTFSGPEGRSAQAALTAKAQ